MKGRVLDALPKAAFGEAIQPASLLLSLDSKGAYSCQGEATTLDALKKRLESEGVRDSGGINLKPILLEVHPSLKIFNLQALYTVLMDAAMANLSFLVQTPEGIRALAMPVPVDHGGREFLWFVDGDFTCKDFPGPKGYRWVEARLQGPDRLRVLGVRTGGEHRPFQAEDPNAPPEASKSSPEPRVPPDSPLGEGSHPLSDVVDFMKAPRPDGLTCLLQLTLEPGDSIADFVACLSEIKKTAGHRVIVYVPIKER